jgi:two component regulator with propeller domain
MKVKIAFLTLLLLAVSISCLVSAGWGAIFFDEPRRNPRTDGVLPLEWLRIPSSESHLGPIGNRVTALTMDPTGSIWIGTTNGLSHFDGSRFRHFGAARNLPHPQVTQIVVWKWGVVAATPRGLAAISTPVTPNSRAKTLLKASISTVLRMGDRFWFAGIEIDTRPDSPKPILGFVEVGSKRVLTEDDIHLIDLSQWPSGPRQPITRLLAGPGGVLLSEHSDGARHWVDNNGQPLAERVPPVLKAIQTQTCESATLFLIDGRLGLASSHTEASLSVEMEGEHLIDLIARRGFPDTVETGVWAVTAGRLFTVDHCGNSTPRYSTPYGYKPTAFVEDMMGRFWFGSTGGLYFADPHRSQSLSDPDLYPEQFEEKFEVDTAGVTDYGSVWKFGENRLLVYRNEGAAGSTIEFRGGEIQTVSELKNPKSTPLLIGTTKGLFRSDSGILTRVLLNKATWAEAREEDLDSA